MKKKAKLTIWGSARAARYHRWGHLTLEDEYRAEVIKERPGTGEQYVADTHGPVMWKLRCDCGYEFDLPKDQFPGRRILRSCNRIECPYTPAAHKKPRRAALGRPVSVNGAVYSIYLSVELAEGVRAYAAKRGLSFSRAVGELAQAGLIQKLVDE